MIFDTFTTFTPCLDWVRVPSTLSGTQHDCCTTRMLVATLSIIKNKQYTCRFLRVHENGGTINARDGTKIRHKRKPVS